MKNREPGPEENRCKVVNEEVLSFQGNEGKGREEEWWKANWKKRLRKKAECHRIPAVSLRGIRTVWR